MKIALVHDYLNEFGGAELVLMELAKMFPEAPIYTAFKVSGSSAELAFKERKIITSWMQNIPGVERFYSPLRFFIPAIWKSFDLSKYDLIISSASWYITKGFVKREGQVEICYCHTPPRWLYGFTTSVNMQKYLPVRIYAAVVGHFLRRYDFEQAQKVTQFVANSMNVKQRIAKYYRRESEVIYPPVGIIEQDEEKQDYYLMVTRIVGAKGIDMACRAADKWGFKLVIAGEKRGYSKFDFSKYKNVSYVGRVSDDEKFKLMNRAKAFVALSKDEDFGITLVEAQGVGTPVIAFNGGGYKETVVDGETGVLFDRLDEKGLYEAILRFEKIKWDRKKIINNAKKFSSEKFRKQMLELVSKYA